MINIRPLSPNDIERAIEIVGSHNPAHAEMAKRDLHAHFNKRFFPGSFFVGATLEDRLIGLMGLYDDPDPDVKNICWVVWFYVDPGFRKQGVGKALHNAIIQEAGKRSARKLYVDVGNEEDHMDAIKVYEKAGYVREGKMVDYFTEGEHKLIFSLRLNHT